jgi:hypothetical protein
MSFVKSTAANADALIEDQAVELPVVALPHAGDAVQLWWRAVIVGGIVLTYFLLSESAWVLMDKWLLESLGFEQVFWTNFRIGSILFAIGFAGVTAGIMIPALVNRIDHAWRRLIVTCGVLIGLVGGYLLARRYLEFLLLMNGTVTGERDSVFGNDIGFYMFSLPALWVAWLAVFVSMCFALGSAVLCIWLANRSVPDPHALQLGQFAKPTTLAPLTAIGVLGAIGAWLARYDLLWKDNHQSKVYAGPAYVDVTGLFSHLNHYGVRALLVLLFTGAIVYALLQARGVMYGRVSNSARRLAFRRARLVVVALIAVDFTFASVVGLRQVIFGRPNEPVIQLPFIQQHIDATLRGYALDRIETVRFMPNGPADPIPQAAELLSNPTLQNAPLWPGWTAYLEEVVDPQHADRILLTGGDPLVYGPVLDVFRQQQQLRTYYDFMDIDTVRYMVDGTPRLFVSATRELPLDAPQPWLLHWGQRQILFTHGYGLVVSPVNELGHDGGPTFVSSGLPPQTDIPSLQTTRHAIYYGEGSGKMTFTNAYDIKEFDYASDEGRIEVVYPVEVNAGVTVDSMLKRLVLAWRNAGNFFDVLFSGLIGPETRVHYFRRPLDRIERITPFLYIDTDPYAVLADGEVVWMLHGMTTSDRYPFSRPEWLGDKSNAQSIDHRLHRRVNYVRDAIKVVIDAYTGQVTLYQIANEPVADTWARIYPGLFTPGTQIPEELRDHLQYSTQMMHIQFDDIYWYYHMDDPMTFFNFEDAWDDADEVLGPIIDTGESISFSIEPRQWILQTGKAFPLAETGIQLGLSLPFTNERALNLRAFATVYQDGADYGRIVVQQIPKGHFVQSPEQADAAIDQDPRISEQISWWNRQGSDVIHGHTSTLIVDNEIIYVAPLFTRSQQNPVPQMKRVIVVFRGQPADGATLEEALFAAVEKVHNAQGRIVQADDSVPAVPHEGRTASRIKTEARCCALRVWSEAAPDLARRSLARLRTDEIDRLQLHALVHRWEQALPPGGALDAVLQAREEGWSASSA